jgi:ABC-2 type transport system permease protein
MVRFGVLLWKELREQWRTARLPILAAIFLFFGFLSPLTAKYMPELLKQFAGPIQITMPPPATKDAVDQLIKNLAQIGTLAAILVTMGTVAREKEQGTAAFVLTKPATRGTFLLAKFVALLITFGISMAFAGLAAYSYTAILFELLPPGGFLAGCLLLLVELTVYVALTFLGSTLVRSSLPAAGIGLAGLLLMGLLSIIPNIGRFTPDGLNAPARALALGQPPAQLWLPLVASLGVIAILLAVAWRSFRTQEL